MSTHNIKKEITVTSQGAPEGARNSRGKRAISVRATVQGVFFGPFLK